METSAAVSLSIINAACALALAFVLTPWSMDLMSTRTRIHRGTARSARMCVLLLAPSLSAACVSTVDAPRLTEDVAARIREAPSPHFAAWVGWNPTSRIPELWPERAAEDVEDLKELLATSPWFDTVEVERDHASVLIEIEEVASTPYYHAPMHNPGMMLIAIVIPVPWSMSTGYRLSVSSPGSKAPVHVDTRRVSTALSGTLAPLFNYHPDLSFVPSSERELDQILAQLLPLVEREK